MVKRRTIVELLNERGWVDSFPKDDWQLRFVPLLELPEFREMEQKEFIETIEKNHKRNYLETSMNLDPKFLCLKMDIKILAPDVDLSQLFKFYFIDQTNFSIIPKEDNIDDNPYHLFFSMYLYTPGSPYRYQIEYLPDRDKYEHPCSVECFLKAKITRPSFLCYISCLGEQYYPCEEREWVVAGDSDSLSLLNKEIKDFCSK